jgi:hypothetical protein
MTLRVFCLGVAASALLFSPVVAQTVSPAASDTSAAAQAAPAGAPSAIPTPATGAPAPGATSTPAPPVVVPEAHSGPIPPPPPGKGQIVFFRKSNYFGMLDWFNVRENGVALGKLTNGTYFVKITEPGTHTYTAATENHNVLHLEIDDGETYFIRGTMTMGVIIYEANMAPSDEATFDKAYPHLKLAKPPGPEPVKTGG